MVLWIIRYFCIPKSIESYRVNLYGLKFCYTKTHVNNNNNNKKMYEYFFLLKKSVGNQNCIIIFPGVPQQPQSGILFFCACSEISVPIHDEGNPWMIKSWSHTSDRYFWFSSRCVWPGELNTMKYRHSIFGTRHLVNCEDLGILTRNLPSSPSSSVGRAQGS